MASDEISSTNEEEMDFLAKRFIRFLCSKENPSGGFERDSSSRKELRLGKKDDQFDDEPKRW